MCREGGGGGGGSITLQTQGAGVAFYVEVFVVISALSIGIIIKGALLWWSTM